MLIGWAISEALSGLIRFTQVSKDIANSAKELGDSFNNAKSEVSDYKTKIEELHSTINDSRASIKDVTEALTISELAQRAASDAQAKTVLDKIIVQKCGSSRK